MNRRLKKKLSSFSLKGKVGPPDPVELKSPVGRTQSSPTTSASGGESSSSLPSVSFRSKLESDQLIVRDLVRKDGVCEGREIFG